MRMMKALLHSGNDQGHRFLCNSEVTRVRESGAVGHGLQLLLQQCLGQGDLKGSLKTEPLNYVLGTRGQTQTMSLNSIGKGENRCDSLDGADMTLKDLPYQLIPPATAQSNGKRHQYGQYFSVSNLQDL